MHEGGQVDYEHQTLKGFIEYLQDDETETFTQNDLAILNENLGVPTRILRLSLEAAGFRPTKPPVSRRIRTVNDNPHDRWFGPGSAPTHGGSGHEQINGFAGREG